ncbi:MAG: DedA family protein [Myxococcaceae bacterium]
MGALVASIDRFIAAVGGWGYLVLGVASTVEYVFPPFPGDTLTLLGGVYVARGQRSAVLMFVVLTVGSVVGAGLDFAFGRWLSNRLTTAERGSRVFGMPVERLWTVQEAMRRRGLWWVALNRFMPGVRALVFVAAGAARMPTLPVLLWGLVSAGAFNTLVLWAGISLGGNLEALAGLLARYQLAAWGLVGLAGVGFLLRSLVPREPRP